MRFVKKTRISEKNKEKIRKKTENTIKYKKKRCCNLTIN